MSYLILVMAGLSFGVLCANANIPKIRVLPLVATFTVLAASALVVSAVPISGLDPANMYMFAVAVFAGAILAAPILWREHPLLSGLGYFERLRISLNQTRRLRETYDQPVPQDS